ncbi:MAG: hypothetical protein K8I82_17170 [Anaerolineae bacterium]|nr:hypothetical protein [Anaerolineae bacterium]
MKRFITLTIGAVLGGFGMLGCSSEEIRARSTAQAGTMAYGQTQMETMTALQSTIDHVEFVKTEVFELSQNNANLQATLTAMEVHETPTPIPEALPEIRSDRHYQNVTTSTGVSSSDGCAVDQQDTFYISGSNDPTRIYLTAVAVDVTAGTTYHSRWYHTHEMRYESEVWIPDRDYAEVCIYFWLASTDTPFQGGYWSAELMSNGASVARVRFAMCEPNVLC